MGKLNLFLYPPILLLQLTYTQKSFLITPSSYLRTLIEGLVTLKANSTLCLVCLVLFALSFFICLIIVRKNDGNIEALDLISLGMSGVPIILSLLSIVIVIFRERSIIFIIASSLVILGIYHKTIQNVIHESSWRKFSS
jgi:hypothetical protein